MAKQGPAEPEARRTGRRRKRKARRGRGEAAAGPAPQGPGMAAAPPRSPREFSSNWKALQELLKQKVNSANESVSACQTFTTKHPVKAGNGQGVPAVNGNVVKAKSTHKTDNGSAKDSPPLAKEKSKSVAVDEKLNSTKSGGKGCKEKKKNGSILKEKVNIKHKRRKAEEHAEEQPKEAEIWFDDVDPNDIEAAIGPEAAKIARRNLGLETGQPKQSVEQVLVKEKASEGLTRAVAMDCEMVGVGPKGEDSIVARVSIVNQFGKCVYDKYVKPTEEVTDYRTAVSGIRPENINTGEDFKTVQKEVANILNGRILVGHALRNDLKVLFLDHPQKKIRDTQRYKPFRQRVKNGRPSLKLLCERLLNVQVQTSEHCSIQDAQAAMRLYTLEKKKWEAAVKNKSNNKNCKT
ncbi:RNA exonuclease 4 isoform X1 [Falco naumanni]|uniref:RNA exonuclease 4 isoform X1 n=1 Tax=Falco naumanni TaxID=148594 RepID=UPI001ADE8BEF|nr:RNA exonuclease 4 isoform X1 [Falco naumanni]XP_040461216.1 RNA exonuclease 4 isoform X1 [Falco naumanni]